MQQVIEAILSLSKNIRYVAIYHDKELSVSSKANSLGASSSESDK